MNKKIFINNVKNYYARHKRDLPWRQMTDPYKILVSEVMLQQTQVNRVVPKYREFLQQFPNIDILSQQPLKNVLKIWSGLGYNRRAKYLLQIANVIQTSYGGAVPNSVDKLIALPGIGHNTAAAIVVYSFNKPETFIETNIRSVYIHYFFNERFNVSDKEILQLQEQTIDKRNPREWYWALMDLGAHIKAKHANPSRKSRHYKKQSAFVGSRRQLRANIIQALIKTPLDQEQLYKLFPDDRLGSVISDLVNEGFIIKHRQAVHLA